MYNVLILGASYGSLLAAKLVLAAHTVKLVCLPAEADAINAEGIRVRLPVKGRDGLVEVDSRRAPGSISAAAPQAADPARHDLVVLAMQEPQYRSSGVRELLAGAARSRVPCMSIMNMPPLPYLARIPGLRTEALADCYSDAAVWDGFDPARVTLCSPDPQAFRPPEAKINVLQVSLPTNFKAARFDDPAHTAMLRTIAAGIEAIRFEDRGREIDLPVKLKVHDSLFVPLAKWSMLLAGNYRCVGPEAMISIRDAVHGDLAASRRVYEWVGEVCMALGAAENDLVPFDKYTAAALGLTRPSSAARALAAGATHIERTDRLVQAIARRKGMRLEAVDEVVSRIDARLAANRRAA